KLLSLQTILLIGATLDMEIHQMNVKTAFLNSDIDAEVYIEQLQGYEQGTNLVCHLQKGLYGLKQASHLWNQRINSHLMSQRFKKCVMDPCIYVRRTKNNVAIIGIWVDNIIIITDNQEVQRIKSVTVRCYHCSRPSHNQEFGSLT